MFVDLFNSSLVPILEVIIHHIVYLVLVILVKSWRWVVYILVIHLV